MGLTSEYTFGQSDDNLKEVVLRHGDNTNRPLATGRLLHYVEISIKISKNNKRSV